MNLLVIILILFAPMTIAYGQQGIKMTNKEYQQLKVHEGDKFENYTGEEIRVYHPNAKKGLIRITSDRKYIYKVEESPLEGAASVRIGMVSFNNFARSDGSYTFSDIYDSEVPMLIYEHEWQLTRRFGILGLQLGTGIVSSQGKGYLDDTGIEATEGFTFIGIPTSGNLIYRFQYWDKQWLVPHVAGGAGVLGFTELRDDDKGPKFGAAYFAFAAAGGAISLNALSPTSGVMMDREYGINTSWIIAEFRLMEKIAGNFDVSTNFVNFGLLLEF